MSSFKPSTETGKDVRAKILLWGPPGSGKTHTAMTWPLPALVDLETRGRNFADRFEFQHAEVTSLDQLAEVFKELRAGQLACETIVGDSATAFYYKLVMEYTKRTDSGALVTDWVMVNRRFLAGMDFVFSIAGKNVIFTAHAGTKLERNGRDFKVAGSKFVGDDRFRFAFDYIFRIEPHGDPAKNPATFHVEKTASPHLPIGSAIRGLDYAKFTALVSGQSVPRTVERAGGSNSDGSGALTSPRAGGGTSAQPQPAVDDGTPATVEQRDRIEVLSLSQGLTGSLLADFVKAVTRRTALYQTATSAEAVRIIAALERRKEEGVT